MYSFLIFVRRPLQSNKWFASFLIREQVTFFNTKLKSSKRIAIQTCGHEYLGYMEQLKVLLKLLDLSTRLVSYSWRSLWATCLRTSLLSTAIAGSKCFFLKSDWLLKERSARYLGLNEHPVSSPEDRSSQCSGVGVSLWDSLLWAVAEWFNSFFCETCSGVVCSCENIQMPFC